MHIFDVQKTRMQLVCLFVLFEFRSFRSVRTIGGPGGVIGRASQGQIKVGEPPVTKQPKGPSIGNCAANATYCRPLSPQYHADAAGRGEEHHHDRPVSGSGRRTEEECVRLRPSALARTHLRHQRYENPSRSKRQGQLQTACSAS